MDPFPNDISIMIIRMLDLRSIQRMLLLSRAVYELVVKAFGRVSIDNTKLISYVILSAIRGDSYTEHEYINKIFPKYDLRIHADKVLYWVCGFNGDDANKLAHGDKYLRWLVICKTYVEYIISIVHTDFYTELCVQLIDNRNYFGIDALLDSRFGYCSKQTNFRNVVLYALKHDTEIIKSTTEYKSISGCMLPHILWKKRIVDCEDFGNENMAMIIGILVTETILSKKHISSAAIVALEALQTATIRQLSSEDVMKCVNISLLEPVWADEINLCPEYTAEYKSHMLSKNQMRLRVKNTLCKFICNDLPGAANVRDILSRYKKE